MSAFIDETGRTYGKLKVLEFNKEKQKWKCQCECGNIIYARGPLLRKGDYTSCGCNRGGNRIRDDLTGKTFGKLKVLKYINAKEGYLCQCECGNIIHTNVFNLKKKGQTDCGCTTSKKYQLIKKDERFKRLYSIYNRMKDRCYRKKCDAYKYYGGKGIKICDEWLGDNGFFNFFNWAIKNGYTEIEGDLIDKLSIDRIDSDKDYCPENCRWLTLYDNIARSSVNGGKLEKKVVTLNMQSQDELVQNYIQRKMELQEKEMSKDKKESKGNFFFRKPNYCILHNFDNTKQFLFKNYKNVALFLEVSVSSVGYRVKKKDGVIIDGWKLEKISKEDFDIFKSKGVEIIS